MEREGHPFPSHPLQDHLGRQGIPEARGRRQEQDAQGGRQEPGAPHRRGRAVDQGHHHGRFQAGREVGFPPHHQEQQDPHRLRSGPRIRGDPLFRHPRGAAPGFHRRRGHHPRPPRPLRYPSRSFQIRIQGTRLLHRAHQGPDGPAAARQHQTGLRRGQEEPVHREGREERDPPHHPPQVQRDHRHHPRREAHLPQRGTHPGIRHRTLPHRSPEIPSSRRPGSSTPRSTSSPGARPSSSSPPTEATTTCSPPGRTPPSSSEI